jgi:SPP1 gp7 family putative phage head morphogenesis protein
MKARDVGQIINSIIERVQSMLNINNILSVMRKDLTTNYTKGLDEIGVQFDMNFERNPAQLNYLNEYAFDNIKNMNDEIAAKLRQQLKISLLNNEPLSKMTTRVREIMDVAETRARMIARTEMQRAQAMGRFQAAEQSGLKLKKWLLVTEDERTSDICGALHDKYGSPEQAIPANQNFTVTVKGKIISQLHDPFHPNCRTRTMYEPVKKQVNA